jgi:hypothetical protein
LQTGLTKGVRWVHGDPFFFVVIKRMVKSATAARPRCSGRVFRALVTGTNVTKYRRPLQLVCFDWRASRSSAQKKALVARAEQAGC